MTDKEFTLIICRLAEVSGILVGIKYHSDISQDVLSVLEHARACIDDSLTKLIADRNGETDGN